MRRRWPAALSAAALAGPLIVASTLTVPAPANAAITACQTWTDAMQPPPATTNDTLASVAALSAANTWAVGTSRVGATAQVLIEHWNGSAWAIMPAPRLSGSSLFSVRAAAPTSIWAVGNVLNARRQERTLILHWNGKAWAQQPSPNPGKAFDELFGVRVVSATSAWAVGDFSNGRGEGSLILHWNGTAWKRVPSPSPAASTALTAVAATSSVNAWAVGLVSNATEAARRGTRMLPAASADPRTFILHWNGRTWSQVTTPSPGASDSLEGVGATSATNAWAVGVGSAGGPEQTLILHWNGRTWRRVASPSPGSNSLLFGVTATSRANAWAIGDFGDQVDQTLILHWNGKTWRRVASPDPGGSGVSNDLAGVTATSAGNAWAVGTFDDHEAGSTFPEGFVLQWDGSGWRRVDNLAGDTELFGVAASSAANAWAVGAGMGYTSTQPLTLHCMS